MASNKKINIPIPDLSSKEKYALIDSIESDHEENIDNLMNEFDTKFIDYSLFEVGMRHKDIGQVTSDSRQYSKGKFDSNKCANRRSSNATSVR